LISDEKAEVVAIGDQLAKPKFFATQKRKQALI
jgi:hypothetical protein